MNYTKEQLDQLMKESVYRTEKLVQEYRRTHKIPSRGIIFTPEIDAERAEQKRIFGEYCKLHKQNGTSQ